MSISNPITSNPVSKFIEFDGEVFKFYFYDKDQSKRIFLNYPLRFIVLDELTCIKGFSDKYRCGIYSNEIKSVKNEILHVKTFKAGFSISGLYDEIKPKLEGTGAKYTKAIYSLLVNSDNTYELVNFQLKGATFSRWYDKNINTNKFGIVINGNFEQKKGKVTYQVPIFEKFEIQKNILDLAISEDKKLQLYFAERNINRSESDQSGVE